MDNPPTELEQRLEERARKVEQKRIYQEPEMHRTHAFRRMGEIGAARLEECEDCGLVVGVAR